MTTKQSIILKIKCALIFFIAFFFFCIASYSQKVMKVFYNYTYNRVLKEEWQIDKDGFKNGYYKSYFRNTMPNEIGQYKNDKQTGVWKQYDEDGKLHYLTTYKDGKYDGLSQVWVNGVGYHNLSSESYYDSYGTYREVSYYKGGIIKSDIKRDGECKIFYDKDKPAKTWVNKNAEAVTSSIKIFTDIGQVYRLDITFNGITYFCNADIADGSDGYYIIPPTRYVGDSLGWTITISGPIRWNQYARTAPYYEESEWWEGIPDSISTKFGVRYAEYKIVKEKGSNCIEMTYLFPPDDYKTSWLYGLQFLPYSYLIKTIEFSGGGDSRGVPTKITFFDSEGKIIKSAQGLSSNGHKRDYQGKLNFMLL